MKKEEMSKEECKRHRVRTIIKIVAILIIFIPFISIGTYMYTEHVKEIEGMKVTMIGASNMKDKENVNSMGYFIRTRNGKTIFIDGGRDFDYDDVKYYIDTYCNGTVDYWFLSHGHSDHVNAFVKLINEDNSFVVKNVYHSLLSDEWYKEYDKRGYESSHALIESLKDEQILNVVNCKKNQIIEIDNVKCEILRIADPAITNTDNGNDASMVFKFTATDVNKSIIFLGDGLKNVSKEVLENPESLKSDAVQMAHHGQNGVTQEVYQAINPDVCFFNCPEWLWNNDNGGGYNSGSWQTVTVRDWMSEMNTTNYAAYEGDQTFHFNRNGVLKLEGN